MFLLGRTYFRAGFLERAKQIFLNILKNNPRTPEALHYLLLVYEYMRDYDLALEVLEPLDELENNVELDAYYLKAMKLLNDNNILADVKAKELLDIYKQSGAFAYLIFEYLFRINPIYAWKNFDASKSALLLDILWGLDKKDLDLDIISKNTYLKELYTARGDIKELIKSNVFELDVLINLDTKASATLSFEYACDKCKHIFPFAFSRCSNCHSIDTQRIELSLSKKYYRDFDEDNNSFQ